MSNNNNNNNNKSNYVNNICKLYSKQPQEQQLHCLHTTILLWRIIYSWRSITNKYSPAF